MWAHVAGERFVASSDHAAVQVQAFRQWSPDRTTVTWTVALNNLQFDAPHSVSLAWQRIPADVFAIHGIGLRRLTWDEQAASPSITTTALAVEGGLPRPRMLNTGVRE